MNKIYELKNGLYSSFLPQKNSKSNGEILKRLLNTTEQELVKAAIQQIRSPIIELKIFLTWQKMVRIPPIDFSSYSKTSNGTKDLVTKLELNFPIGFPYNRKSKKL